METVHPSTRAVNSGRGTGLYSNAALVESLVNSCYSHAGPAAWNYLPDNIKLTIDIVRFKSFLKLHLFHLAFLHFVSVPGEPISQALQIPICICMCDAGKSIVRIFEIFSWT